MGMTIPPLFRRVSWSLVVSQSIEQKRDYMVRLRISLKEKLSAISARRLISISWEGGGWRRICCSLQAARTSKPRAMMEDWPSKPEWRMLSWWVRMSTATKRDELAS